LTHFDFVYSKPSAGRPGEHLTGLVYELLDAHDDTVRLAGDLTADPRWNAHREYLRDLQRVGREALARAWGWEEAPPTSGARSESGR
jgi:hypothetical protein